MKFATLAIIFALAMVAGCQSNNNRKAAEENTTSKQSRLQQLNAAIKGNPNNGDVYFDRAQYWKNRKNFGKAIQDINNALKTDSTSAKYLTEKGNILYLNGKVSKATTLFEQALEADPNRTDALMGLAEIKLVLRKYQKSMNAINRALKVDERLYRGYFLKGFIFKETGDTTRALSSFQTAVEVKPDFYEGYMMLGMMNQRKGDSLAIQYYKTAMELNPQSDEPKTNIAEFYQNNGRPQKALRIYNELLDTDSANALAYFNSGYIFLTQLNNYDSAHYYFDKSVQNHPNYTEAIYNRGYSSELMGNTSDALADYRKALSINAQYDKAARGLERVKDKR